MRLKNTHFSKFKKNLIDFNVFFSSFRYFNIDNKIQTLTPRFNMLIFAFRCFLFASLTKQKSTKTQVSSMDEKKSELLPLFLILFFYLINERNKINYFGVNQIKLILPKIKKKKKKKFHE